LSTRDYERDNRLGVRERKTHTQRGEAVCWLPTATARTLSPLLSFSLFFTIRATERNERKKSQYARAREKDERRRERER
jgi:hypothetical protein